MTKLRKSLIGTAVVSFAGLLCVAIMPITQPTISVGVWVALGVLLSSLGISLNLLAGGSGF